MSESPRKKSGEGTATTERANAEPEPTSPRSGVRKHQKLIKEDDKHHVIIYIPKKGDSSRLVKVTPEKKPEIAKYLDMGKAQLQSWLRHNGQLVTGNKQDLLLRCIDGQINGRIPGCSRCRHGQMHYDYTQGLYVCNGYFDKQSRTPIRCGHTEQEVKREPWHDIEKDKPVKAGGEQAQEDDGKDHHQCQVEANHPLVDLLEEMAYLHSILKDDNWTYKARAFKTAASAIEVVDYEIKDAHKIGDRRSDEHIERVGKTCAEALQAFLDSGKKHSPHLDELKRALEEHERKNEEEK